MLFSASGVLWGRKRSDCGAKDISLLWQPLVWTGPLCLVRVCTSCSLTPVCHHVSVGLLLLEMIACSQCVFEKLISICRSFCITCVHSHVTVEVLFPSLIALVAVEVFVYCANVKAFTFCSHLRKPWKCFLSPPAGTCWSAAAVVWSTAADSTGWEIRTPRAASCDLRSNMSGKEWVHYNVYLFLKHQ